MLILNPLTGQLVEVRVPRPGTKAPCDRSNGDAHAVSPTFRAQAHPISR